MFALYLAGPVEHRGTVGIRPNHLLAATLSLFRQGGGVDYARHIWMFQLILIRSAVPG